jgi:2'-5' RNA ligase
MLRLFFAVQTPPPLVEELRRVQDELVKGLEALRPTPNFKRENLSNSHCTIRFLGDVEEDKVQLLEQKVGDEIGKARLPAFEMSLTQCGMFPHRGKARVIWVGLEPIQVLRELRTVTNKGIPTVGIRIADENEFHPHLTLVRFREPYRLPQDFVFPLPNPSVASVPEVLLISSRTLPQGAQHDVIGRFPLTG